MSPELQHVLVARALEIMELFTAAEFSVEVCATGVGTDVPGGCGGVFVHVDGSVELAAATYEEEPSLTFIEATHWPCVKAIADKWPLPTGET